MLSYYRADRISLLQYHQLPLRTFYFGGGYPLIANPQDGFLNPFFIPVLIFGEIIGMKANVFLAHIIAAMGMYYLARYVLKYNYLGAFFAAVVFTLGGHMHRLLIRGQDYVSTFYCFFIPLLFAFFIKAKEHRRYLIYAVLVLTAIVSQAGLYVAPIMLFIFLVGLLEACKFRDKRFSFEAVYLKNFLILALLTFFLGAVKIFPMLELLKQDMRVMEGYNPFWGISLPTLAKVFLQRLPYLPSAGVHWAYFYVGCIPAIFLVSSLAAYWRETKKLFMLLVIFMFLSFSAVTWVDLFKLLWQLPIFHSIESPVRYFIPIVIFLIALIAGKVFSLRDKLNSKFITGFFICATVLTTADLLFINGVRQESFGGSIPGQMEQVEFFQVKNHAPGDKVSTLIPKSMFLRHSWEWTMPSQYELMLYNVGKINWYGNIHLGEYAAPKYFIHWNGVESVEPENYSWVINPEYKGELYFLNNAKNTAKFQYFSPNEIIVDASLLGPDTLVINQNYDKYWRAGLLKPLSHNGLLALKLEQAGSYRIKFIYIPWNFYLGLAVSIITFIFITMRLHR